MKIEYVILQYCPGVLSASGRRVGLVYRALGSSQLHVRTVLNWKRDIPEEDLDYIQDVFTDLDTLSGQRALSGFDSIAEMSAGPLRTEALGVCEEQAIASILLSRTEALQ